MNFEDIDIIARGTGHMPDGLNLTEIMCFSVLRGLYDTYRSGGIFREDAVKEKKAIRMAYHQAVEDNNRHYAMYCQYQENIRQAEMNMHEIVKGARDGREQEELFKLAIQCIAAMTRDTCFEKLVIGKGMQDEKQIP